MKKKVLLIINLLLPFFIFSQIITSISPNQGSQGQQVPLIISGNNMSFTGWSCWSQTSNLTQFRFSQWSGTNMFYGVSTSSVGQQLFGHVDIDPSQPTGLYNLAVLNCSNTGWVSFLNSFQINLPTWDCDGQGNCLDLGTGLGTYTSLSACLSSCIQASILIENIKRLKIYPNPSSDIINIQFKSLVAQDIRLSIINGIGELVFSDNLVDHTGDYKKQIDLKENEKGIYFLEIETNDGVINKKLILQ